MVVTGIELALAVAPLIISGADAYRALWEKTKIITRQKTKKEKQEDFFRDLHCEIGLLQLVLRGLVLELPNLSQDQKKALMEHDKHCWSTTEVASALKERLHGFEEIFRETLHGLLKALDSLIRHKSAELGSVESHQHEGVFAKLKELRSTSQTEGSMTQRFVARWNFATNMKTRALALHRIGQCNKRLQNLLEQVTKINDADRRSLNRTGPPLDRCRKLIQALHTTMSACSACECDTPHEARLCLLRYSSIPENDSTITSLDMLISASPAGERHGLLWQESHVRIIANQSTSETTPKVKWEVNGELVSPQSERSTSTSISTSASTLQRSARSPVASLCSLIKEKGVHKVSVGIDYEEGTLWRGQARRRSLSEPEGAIPLGELLHRAGMRLTLRRKRTLAVVVAHAVLNFCESPWFNRRWNKQHILFFQHSSPSAQIDLVRPYLSTIFDKDSSTEATQPDFLSLHQSPPILALGVLLLELEMCQPIESQYHPEDLDDGEPNSNTNLTAAQRLLEERVENIYEGYRSAIEACLKCDFMAEEELSLDSDAFRRNIYERIVAPLEDELQHCSGMSPDELLKQEMEGGPGSDYSSQESVRTH